MHRRLAQRLSCLLFLLVLASTAMGQYGSTLQPGVRLRGRSFAELYAAQRTLLSDYCRLDFEGVRLQSSGWSRFKPFTSLRANPDFTRVLIVTRFDIEAPAQPTEQLYVNYQEVGFYDEEEGYSALPATVQIAFRVREQNGDLLVTEVKPETPHVSPRAAVAWMTLRLTDPKITELERAHLRDAVTQLNKLLPPPHPATAAPPGA